MKHLPRTLCRVLALLATLPSLVGCASSPAPTSETPGKKAAVDTTDRSHSK